MMARDIHEVDLGTYRMSLRGMSPDELRGLAKHIADTADAIEDEQRRAKARRATVVYSTSCSSGYYHWPRANSLGNVPPAEGA